MDKVSGAPPNFAIAQLRLEAVLPAHSRWKMNFDAVSYIFNVFSAKNSDHQARNHRNKPFSGCSFLCLHLFLALRPYLVIYFINLDLCISFDRLSGRTSALPFVCIFGALSAFVFNGDRIERTSIPPTYEGSINSR